MFVGDKVVLGPSFRSAQARLANLALAADPEGGAEGASAARTGPRAAPAASGAD